MTDTYDGNGDYSPYNDDDNDYGKQRKCGGNVAGGGVGGVGNSNMVGPHNGDHAGVGGGVGPGDGVHLNEKASEYIRDCLTEKNRMDRKFPIAEKLLDSEIEKVQITGRISSREQKYADIYREKHLRVSQKVLVPIREHPKFNFVGKLLGPKGNSLRRLQEETLCKMTVLGRNSMRDRVKEEELRCSKDPKYVHLNFDLHVEISTVAPPAEAYARVAYAMAELRKYLIPDSNDVIRQEQLRELMDNTGLSDTDGSGGGKPSYKKAPTHQPSSSVGGNNMGMGLGGSSVGSGSGMSAQGVPGVNKSMQPHHSYRSQNQPQTQQQTPFVKNAVAPKQKVLSILEKARTAMDETYGRGFDEHMSYEQPTFDTYPTYGHTTSTGPHSHTPHGPQSTGMNVTNMGVLRTPYETTEYDTDYNRRDYYQHSPGYGVSNASAVAAQVNQNVGGLNLNHNRSHVNR